MKTAFVFSGQGAQTVGMGKDLYESSRAAKDVYDRADAALGWSLTDVCFNGPEEKLTNSCYCQAAIYATSCACLAAFREARPDLVPVAVGGLSLGEYSAFAAADAFSFEDGLRLVAKRGELMDKACQETDGGMASIIAGKPEVIAAVCEECGIDVANYNCPGQIVISGPKDRVAEACAKIKASGAKRALPLNVAGGFHSRLMKSAGEALRDVLDAVPMKTPAVPVLQNVIGDVETDVAKIKANLVAQVAGSVRWEDCVRVMADRFGAERFIEFGPGAVLTGLIRRTLSDAVLLNCSGKESLDAALAQL